MREQQGNQTRQTKAATFQSIRTHSRCIAHTTRGLAASEMFLKAAIRFLTCSASPAPGTTHHQIAPALARLLPVVRKALLLEGATKVVPNAILLVERCHNDVCMTRIVSIVEGGWLLSMPAYGGATSAAVVDRCPRNSCTPHPGKGVLGSPEASSVTSSGVKTYACELTYMSTIFCRACKETQSCVPVHGVRGA